MLWYRLCSAQFTQSSTTQGRSIRAVNDDPPFCPRPKRILLRFNSAARQGAMLPFFISVALR
jgi:hypothetical protein